MKKLLLIMFLLMFAVTTNAYAHTHLESSSPENGQVVTEELSEISLTFEGKVEQSSSFEVISSGGQSIPVENISIHEEQMTGTLTNLLVDGDYTVTWNIIGADGHPIEGEFSFTVNLSESTAPAENEGEVKSEDGEVHEQDEATHGHSEENAAGEQNEETDEGQLPSYLVPVIVIVLIIIIVGVFWGLRKKE